MHVNEPNFEINRNEIEGIEVSEESSPARKKKIFASLKPKEPEYCAQCEIMGICPRHDLSYGMSKRTSKPNENRNRSRKGK